MTYSETPELRNERVRLELGHAWNRRSVPGTAVNPAAKRLLRRHRITPAGDVRDTVVFSILDSERPGVRAGLDARIA